MRFGLTTGKSLCAGIVLVALVIFAMAPSVSAVESLRVTVGDTTGNSGELNSAITVTLNNVFDTIAAFEVWLQLSRPDLMLFQTELDTVVDTTYWNCIEFFDLTCIDSISCDPDSTTCELEYIDTVEAFTGNIDTAGSLVSGWELMTTRSISGTGTDIKVTGAADLLSVPGTQSGFGPQQGGVLFRLLGDILNVPDTLQDRSVDIYIQPFLSNFSFSRPDGSSIGILTIYVPDTNYYRCIDWLPPDSVLCLDYDKVPTPPYDSIDIGLDTVGILDTSAVHLFSGELTVNAVADSCLAKAACGDIAPVGAPDCFVDVADLTLMINYLFLFGPAPEPLEAGNVDCIVDISTLIDVGDLTALIDHLFITFSPFCCNLGP